MQQPEVTPEQLQRLLQRLSLGAAEDIAAAGGIVAHAQQPAQHIADGRAWLTATMQVDDDCAMLRMQGCCQVVQEGAACKRSKTCPWQAEGCAAEHIGSTALAHRHSSVFNHCNVCSRDSPS